MLLARFFGDCKAGVAPLLALGAIPLIGSVGAAIDYSRASSARTAMQGALDAAAIMMSKQGVQALGDNLSQKATNYFTANFARPELDNLAVSATSSPVTGGTAFNLSADGSVATQFMRLLGFQTMPVAVHASAVAVADGLGCVLSLDPSASGAMTGQGSTAVNLSGCSIYDNSSHSTAALSVGGSAAISALSVGVVGGVSGQANITTEHGVRTGIAPVQDPYANSYFPNFLGCNETNFDAKDTVAINPGVYCGGMKLTAGANVTLNPGIYYIDGGDLTVQGGATLTGTGVTLVFTKKSSNSWANATINGNATINLTPPKSGPTAGIVMFGDRNMPAGTLFKLNGGSTQYLGGAVYIPKGAIQFSGGSSANTGTSCTQVIGNTVTFTGNSALAINCSSYETKPFSAVLIKLAS